MSLQVELLEKSFEEVKPQADEFVDSFYSNLFTMYPEAKPLFAHSNMAEQKKKLLASLVLVVENLKNPDVLGNSLRGLGARHVKYGALPEHYPLVGNSLLTAFEQHLKEKWTPEVKQAWVDAYGAITEIMLDGADYSKKEVALQPDISLSDKDLANLNARPTGMATGEAATMSAEKSNTGKFAILGGGAVGIVVLLLILL
jgi:hemoglobin-like flavoprotein